MKGMRSLSRKWRALFLLENMYDLVYYELYEKDNF